MKDSALSIISALSPGVRGIGSPNRTRTVVPKGTGFRLFSSSFHEPSMAIGTTGRLWAWRRRASEPAFLNSPSRPSRDLVPSGKIATDTLRSWAVTAMSRIAAIA
jgi:hypothetical protein